MSEKLDFSDVEPNAVCEKLLRENADLAKKLEQAKEAVDYALSEDKALFKMTGSHAMVKHIREHLETTLAALESKK